MRLKITRRVTYGVDPDQTVRCVMSGSTLFAQVCQVHFIVDASKICDEWYVTLNNFLFASYHHENIPI